ncbi:MAG: PAS domain-containing hybrid sensor histidine kinase/response regulator [Verrucomicrobiaceae bacterium]|nr:MAG: PAS domain-containing hybrid sensor histidine kinase/response regulator [Verrucomicrobiaceae bacterium]
MDFIPFWLNRVHGRGTALERISRKLLPTSSIHAAGLAGIFGSALWLYQSKRSGLRKDRLRGHQLSRPLPPAVQKLDRAMLDVLPSHICLLDENATIIAVNRSWREFARKNPPVRSEVCEGANYLAVCDAAKDDPEALECAAALRALLAGRLSEFCIEYPCHSPREERWFTVRASRYIDEGLLRVAVVHEPITGRKLAERAVFESEERYRTIVNQAFDGIFVLNPQGEFLFVNDMACDMSGYSREEMLEMSAVQMVPREDHLRFVDLWNALLPGESQQSEWVIIRKDGSRIPIDLRTRRQADGNLLGFICDLSQRKEAESLRQARDAAENASRAKDQFLAMLSHELRTPLAPVLLATHIIEEDRELPDTIRELGATIHRNIDVQVHLIDDLLDETRIASGKLELHCEKTSIHVLIKHVLETLASEFTAKELEVKEAMNASNPHLEGDPARLQQILWNLLKNAVKFTPAKGTITVRTSNPDPKRLRVDVADSGIGIAPDLLAKLFRPFEQGGTLTTRRFGGLGLGLAISKQLAKLHGGMITAYSAGEGQGATFTLELPISNVTSADVLAQPSPATGATVSSRLRILLVEDHADTAYILSQILKRRGYHVHISHCLHDAEAAAETESFDLVLSDIDLPDGTGYELMHFLHEFHPVPGIAMSGFGMQEDVKKSREAGFAEHLVKPVDPDCLKKAIEQVVANAG